MNTSTLLHGGLPDRLAPLALLVAAVTTYVALDLVNWITVSRGTRKVLWVFFGSLGIGLGIWTANILGMKAFGLPGPLRYHWRRCSRLDASSS